MYCTWLLPILLLGPGHVYFELGFYTLHTRVSRDTFFLSK